MTAGAERPPAPRWLLLVALSLAAFITGLDNTVLNIALPALQEDLDLSLSGLQWVGTSYILAFASLLMVGGRLTDLIGRRRILMAGMGIFTVASVFAGLAPNGASLIVCRVVQGVGGALVLPATAAVLASDFAAEDRYLGVGVWTASIASAIALGPLVGGAIIEVAHWSWIFFINIPIGIAAILLARMTVPGQQLALPPRPEFLSRLDLPGLFSSSLALMSFTFVLVHGQEHGFGSPAVLIGVAVGLVSGFLFLRTEKNTEHPLVNLDLFKMRIFAGGTAAQMIWGLGINGVLFFTSLFLQDILGLEPFQAGLFFVPLAVSVAATVPLGAWMANRIGANVTVAIGMLIVAAGLFMGVFISATDPPIQFLMGLVVVGIGSGLTTPMTSAVMDVMPHEQSGGASAVISTARELSGVIGIAAIGAVLVVRRASAIDDGADPTTAFVSGYHLALCVATVVMLIGGVVSQLTLTTHAQQQEMAAVRAAEAEAEAAAGVDAESDEFVVEATTQADGPLAAAEAYNAARELHHEHVANAHGAEHATNGHGAPHEAALPTGDAGDDAERAADRGSEPAPTSSE